MEEQIKNEENVEQSIQETVTTVDDLSKERPTFLTVLCILTFIGSGLGVVGSLMGVLGMSALTGMFGSTVAGGGTIYMLVLLLISAASFYGAIKMWGLEKQGFTIYAAANGVSIILPFIFGMPFVFASFLFGVLITVGFIAMYYVNLKYMS